MKSHYLTELMVKMGVWSLGPLDMGTWHAEPSSRYFKKVFGIYKGTLSILDLRNGHQYPYFPKSYFKKVYNRIIQINKKDYRALSRILKRFYGQKVKGKKTLSKLTAKNYSTLSDQQLVKMFRANRDIIHRITVYDQFGWLAEDYWQPLMENILVKKLHLPKDSAEYQRVLFALVKPEEISTTLEEKRDVLKEAIAIKAKKNTLVKSAGLLAKKYGWMPVFTYGTPWTAEHYKKELAGIINQDLKYLRSEHVKLKNYTKLRNKEFKEIVKKYKVSPRDVQVFIDFGLALDARNESEYVVSFGALYAMPMYREFARRLKLTDRSLRLLYEHEIVGALEKGGELYAKSVLKTRKTMVATGTDPSMKNFILFSAEEAQHMFDHIEAGLKKEAPTAVFKGMCASSGRVSGVARIIPSANQSHKVKPGDILITYTTGVDYLPAMKRAAAFITEVGGLTCHAAVVAREFGVPCIVSLPDAMKKFKDGEMIEVDATNGVVKKIK